MNVCGIVVAHNEDLILPYAIDRMGLPYIAILDNPTDSVREATKSAWHIIEMPKQSGGMHVYMWDNILCLIKRAAMMAAAKRFDWVLRVDADEDWSGAVGAIEEAHDAGCNVVNFLVAQHEPTEIRAYKFDPSFQRPTTKESLIHLEPDGNYYQRAWRVNDGKFNIGAGGHVILRHDSKVHESGFAFKHYPATDKETLIRKASRAYAEKEKLKGWHIQYNGILKDSEQLTKRPSIDLDKADGKRFHIFFHVAMMGIWEDVLAEQIKRIEASGILAECDSATAVCVGCVGDLPTLPGPFKVIHGGDLSRFEFPTLEVLQAKATVDPSASYLYLHTKGVSKPKSRRGLDEEWRRYMMWGCVDHWRECVASLDDNDLAGVEWYAGLSPSASGNKKGGAHGFFAGNFWWAQGEFLSALPRVDQLDQDNRWNAEAWVGLGEKSPQVHEVANLHCSERHGMFPRDFSHASYVHRDNIVLVEVMRAPKKPKTLRRWIDEHVKKPSTIYVIGIDPAWLQFPKYLVCQTRPRHYDEVIVYHGD